MHIFISGAIIPVKFVMSICPKFTTQMHNSVRPLSEQLLNEFKMKLVLADCNEICRENLILIRL
jgi:hypothetical protein